MKHLHTLNTFYGDWSIESQVFTQLVCIVRTQKPFQMTDLKTITPTNPLIINGLLFQEVLDEKKANVQNNETNQLCRCFIIRNFKMSLVLIKFAWCFYNDNSQHFPHNCMCKCAFTLHSLYSQWLPSRKLKSYWLACIHYWVFCNLQTSIYGSLCATVKWQALCNFRSPILLTMTRTLVYRVHFPYKIYNLFASKTICFNHMQITLLAFHGMTTEADTVYMYI